jgi:hypothetical protein
MDEMGHKTPDLALSIYRQTMQREEGAKASLKALVGGVWADDWQMSPPRPRKPSKTWLCSYLVDSEKSSSLRAVGGNPRAAARLRRASIDRALELCHQ